LKAELVNQDLEQKNAGVVFPHGVSPAAFLKRALNIKAAQHVSIPSVHSCFSSLVSRCTLKMPNRCDGDADPTDSFLERHQALSRSITDLRDPQSLHMPGSKPFIDAINPVLIADHPENVELWLPSTLPSTSCNDNCTNGLPKLEY
jgi:hypothetical protein